MILYLASSMKWQIMAFFSKDALEPLMVVIYISPPLLLSKFSIRIKKASFHRIVSSYAISTCSSYTLFQAGKVPQQMLGFGLMHWQRIFCAGSILLSCRCQISSLQGTSCSFSWYLVSSSGVGCCRCLVCTFFF